MSAGGLSPATALIPNAGGKQTIQDAQVFTQATPSPSTFSRKKVAGEMGEKTWDARVLVGHHPDQAEACLTKP